MRYRRQETFRYILPNPRFVPYRLVWEDKELHDSEGELLNNSAHGLKLRCDYLFPLSEGLKVRIMLDLVPTLQSIELTGYVRHRNQIGSLYDYGIRLESHSEVNQELVTMIKSYARENQ